MADRSRPLDNSAIENELFYDSDSDFSDISIENEEQIIESDHYDDNNIQSDVESDVEQGDAEASNRPIPISS